MFVVNSFFLGIWSADEFAIKVWFFITKKGTQADKLLDKCVTETERGKYNDNVVPIEMSESWPSG